MQAHSFDPVNDFSYDEYVYHNNYDAVEPSLTNHNLHASLNDEKIEADFSTGFYPPLPTSDSNMVWQEAKTALFGNGMSISPQELQREFTPDNSSALVGLPSSPFARASSMTPLETRENTPFSGKEEDDDDDNVDPIEPELDIDHRGKYSGCYSQLILQCLLEAPGHEMKLQDMYRWFQKFTVKGYNKHRSGWQNSIRHNLSMNRDFIKGSALSIGDDEKDNKHIWRLSESALVRGVKPTTRYRRASSPKSESESDDESDDESDISNFRVRPKKIAHQRVTSQRSPQHSSGSASGRAARLANRQRQKLQRERRAEEAEFPTSESFSRSATPSPLLPSDSGYDSNYYDSESMRASTPMSSSSGPYYVQPRSAPTMPASAMRMRPTQRAMTSSPQVFPTQRRVHQPLRARSSTPGSGALQPFLRRHNTGPPALRRGVSFPQQQYSFSMPASGSQLGQLSFAPRSMMAHQMPVNAYNNHGGSPYFQPEHVAIDPSLSGSPNTFKTAAEYNGSPSSTGYSTGMDTSFDYSSPAMSFSYGNPDDDVPDMSLGEMAFPSMADEHMYTGNDNDITTYNDTDYDMMIDTDYFN